MKSSYELAMERLMKDSPSTPLTPGQKKELAEIDSLYAAKFAERELFISAELDKAYSKGDPEAIQQLKRQLVSDRKSLEAEREEKKEHVRQQPSGKTPPKK